MPDSILAVLETRCGAKQSIRVPYPPPPTWVMPLILHHRITIPRDDSVPQSLIRTFYFNGFLDLPAVAGIPSRTAYYLEI